MLNAYRCGDVTLATADTSVEPKDTSHWSSSHPHSPSCRFGRSTQVYGNFLEASSANQIAPRLYPNPRPRVPKIPGTSRQKSGRHMPGFGSGAGREEQLSWQAFAFGYT